MSTPIRRHFAAALAAKQTDETDLGHATPYQRLFVRMKQDQAVLNQVQGIQDKAVLKAQMIPKYMDWITGCLESQNVAKTDAVYPTILVWMIDAGMLNQSLPIAELAIRLELESADEYKRKLPVIIIEEIALAVTSGADISAENLEKLVRTCESKVDIGTYAVDMPDKVRAKFFRAAAEWHEEQGGKSRALNLYEKALACDDTIGVKSKIKALSA